MVYPLDSPPCIGVVTTGTRDGSQSNLENQDEEIDRAENAGMVQTTELVCKASHVEVGCASHCDSETSTLVDFSLKDLQNGGSLGTSDGERETSTSEIDNIAEAQMLDADERAWDTPSLKQEFESLKAIVLAIFASRRAVRRR